MSKRGRKEKDSDGGGSGTGDNNTKKSKLLLIDAMAAHVPAVTRKKDEPEAEYRRRCKVREGMVLEERRAVIERISAETPDRDQWSDKLLRWECEMLGLASQGIRPILLQRLAGHRAGQVVMRKEHEHYVLAAKSAAETALASAGEKQQVILRMGNGRGEEGFLALPHDLIRGTLLPLVDPFSLICLARTCKYLEKDATNEIWNRARLMFGPNGTAKALGGFMWLSTDYKSQSVLQPLQPPRRPASWYKEQWAHSLNNLYGMDFAHKYGPMFGLPAKKAIRNSGAAIDELEGNLRFVRMDLLGDHLIEGAIIGNCIKKHGTVDAFLKKKALQEERVTIKAQEREVLALSAESRLKVFERILCVKNATHVFILKGEHFVWMGVLTVSSEVVKLTRHLLKKALNELIRVDIFRLGKDGRDEIRDKVYGISMELVSLTPAGMLLYALHGNHTLAKEHRKCTRHIYEAEPKTGAAAGKFFISLFYDLRVMAYKLRVFYQIVLFFLKKIRAAIEHGLNYRNVKDFAIVFTHVLTMCAENQIADFSTLSTLGVDDGGMKQFFASACKIAANPTESGLFLARNPPEYLNPEAFGNCKHRVVLCVNTPKLKAFRIVEVPARIMARVDVPGQLKVAIEAVTPSTRDGDKVFLITGRMVLAAIDPELAVYLMNCEGFKCKLRLLDRLTGWRPYSDTQILLSADPSAWSGTSSMGAYYRAGVKPYAPIFCLFE